MADSTYAEKAVNEINTMIVRHDRLCGLESAVVKVAYETPIVLEQPDYSLDAAQTCCATMSVRLILHQCHVLAVRLPADLFAID